MWITCILIAARTVYLVHVQNVWSSSRKVQWLQNLTTTCFGANDEDSPAQSVAHECVENNPRQASIIAKGFLKLPNFHVPRKQESITSQKRGCRDFWQIALYLTKVNLLYLLYLTTQRSCLLHLIKRNGLLKTFLRPLILMTEISLYLLSLLGLIWNYIIFL